VTSFAHIDSSILHCKNLKFKPLKTDIKVCVSYTQRIVELQFLQSAEMFSMGLPHRSVNHC